MSFQQLYTESQQLSTPKVRDDIVQQLYERSHRLCAEGIKYTKSNRDTRTEKLDAIFTSPIFGFPIMLTMLGVLFYLTIAGANIPSSMLAEFFGSMEKYLTAFLPLFTHLTGFMVFLFSGYTAVQRGLLASCCLRWRSFFQPSHS